MKLKDFHMKVLQGHMKYGHIIICRVGLYLFFIDNSSGFGDYVLVHSTAQNEPRDDDWRDKINIR